MNCLLILFKNGQDVLQSIREYDELGINPTKVDSSLLSGEKNPGDWKKIWEENQKRLEESLKILQYLQEISQVIKQLNK